MRNAEANLHIYSLIEHLYSLEDHWDSSDIAASVAEAAEWLRADGEQNRKAANEKKRQENKEMAAMYRRQQ